MLGHRQWCLAKAARFDAQHAVEEVFAGVAQAQLNEEEQRSLELCEL